jgi:hypothetical protein
MERYNQKIKLTLDGINLDLINESLENQSDWVHQEQLDAAKELILNFSLEDFDENNERRRHQILKAQMQSGKTGVICSFMNLVHETFIENYWNINKYFILTGMNDKGLGLQTLDRVKKQVHFADETNVDNGKNVGVYDCKECKIVVMRNNDIKKTEHTLENCVVFIDESHYGSGETSVLTKFFLDNGVDWKNQELLVSKNIYLVSVSATPFSEIHSDIAQKKQDVILKTTDKYHGISEYYRKGQILNAKPSDFSQKIDSEFPIISYIKDAYERIETNNNGDKVGLIFIRAYAKKQSVIKNNRYVNEKFKVVELSGQKLDYNKVNEELKMMFSSYDNTKVKPVLFLIKGAYRAGVTINPKDKDYIYMIYDNSSEMAATYQGLAGRISGYRFCEEDKLARIKMYLNMEHVVKYDEWVDGDLNRTLTPGLIGYKVVTQTEEYDFNNETDKWKVEKVGVFNLPLTKNSYEYLSSITHEQSTVRKQKIFDFSKDVLSTLNINIDFIGELYLNKDYKQTIIDRFGGSNNSVPTLRPQNSNFIERTKRREFDLTDVNKLYTHVYVNHESKEIVFSVGKILRVRRIKVSGKYFKPHQNTLLDIA